MEKQINIHNVHGEHVIKVIADSWLCYYSTTKIKADDSFINDVVTMIDTFAGVIGYTKKPGNVTPLIDMDILQQIIGQVILVKGIKSGDTAAIGQLKNICSNIVNTITVVRFDNDEVKQIVDQAIVTIRESLSDVLFEDLEPPLIVNEFARSYVYRVITNYLDNNKRTIPDEIKKLYDAEMANYQVLLTSYHRLRVIEDRIFNLIHSDAYCTWIKRSLLTLKIKQLILLSLCYYQNERIPDTDILEALGDIGEYKTTQGTVIQQTNIDRNIYYTLHNILAKRLTLEFSRILDALENTGEIENNAFFKLYFVNSIDSMHKFEMKKIEDFCSSNLGTEKRELMGDKIIEMCHRLERYIRQGSI